MAYTSDTRQLTDFTDPLLQPRIVEHLYGRDQEIDTLLTWLCRAENSGETVHPVVVAEGGTGKTELCKAVLRRYLDTTPEPAKAWFVSLEAASTVEDLWQRLADAQGWDRSQLYRPEQILAQLPPGIFYLDNLESLCDWNNPNEVATLRNALQQLSNRPGVRLLASCRVAVPNWGQTLDLGPLQPTDAAKLFCEFWPDTAQSLTPDDPDLLKFVQEKLGGLPLAVVLVAAQGQYEHTFGAVRQRWQEEGVAFANSGLDGRLDHLGHSIRLSLRRLSPDARLLWGLSAFFPTGLPEDFFQELLAKKPAFRTARKQLIDHRIWHRDTTSGRLRVSPPLAQFALEQSTANAEGFAAGVIFEFLVAWLEGLGAATKKDRTGTAIARLKEEFLTLETTVEFFVRQPKAPANLISVVLYDWEHYLDRSVFCGKRILETVVNYQKDVVDLKQARALRLLGRLEFRLNHNDEAQSCFKKALSILKHHPDNHEMACTLRDLGRIGFRNEEFVDAESFYKEALSLFEQGDYLGQANTLRSWGELKLRLGDRTAAYSLLNEALILSQKAGDEHCIADVFRNLGRVDIQEHNYRSAQSNLKQALALYEITRSDHSKANVLRNLGEVEIELGNYAEAHSLLKQALTLYEKTGSNIGLANTRRNLGDLLNLQKNLLLAQKEWYQALEIYLKVNEAYGQGFCYANLARTSHQLGDLVTAQQHLQAAQACIQRAGSPQLSAYVAQVAAEINGTA